MRPKENRGAARDANGGSPLMKLRGGIYTLGVLLIANLGILVWIASSRTSLHVPGMKFRVEVLHTNGAEGVGIFERKSERPLWVAWDFSGDGKSDLETFYFNGRSVLDISTPSNSPPRLSVWFRGTGKSATWWIDDSGSGTFSERIYYNTNGLFERREVWFDSGWHTAETRDGKIGVVLAGEWNRLTLDTNGMWTIHGSSNMTGAEVAP